MEISGVSHVNVGVTDMDRSLRFYRDALGLQVTLDREERYEHIPLHQHAVYLRWDDEPGGSFVVLDRQLGREPFGTPPVLQQTGPNHFGFWVSDIDAILDRCRALGFEVGPNPTTPLEGGAYAAAGGSVRTIIIRDPDGAFVQLDQWIELPPGDT